MGALGDSHVTHDSAADQNGRSAVPERGELTHEEAAILAECTAKELLGVSAEEAFAMLDRGELDGTFAEGAMRSLRHLVTR